jgi:diguanylate cyclase (GGDEF)-like protein
VTGQFSGARDSRMNLARVYFIGISIAFLVSVFMARSPVHHWPLVFLIALLIIALEVSVTTVYAAGITLSTTLVLTSVTNFGLFQTELSLLMSLVFLLIYHRKHDLIVVVFNTSQYGLSAMLGLTAYTLCKGVIGTYAHHFTALAACALVYIASNFVFGSVGYILYNRSRMSIRELMQMDWLQMANAYLLDVVLGIAGGVFYQSYGILGLITIFVALWVLISLYQRYFKVTQAAETDDLTGLLNRKTFQKRVARQMRRQRALSLLMIDLDHFKNVNDSLGHQRGDDVLHEIADLIKSSVGQAGTVSRYGGEEFCVLLYTGDGPQFAENLRKTVEDYRLKTPGDVRLSISVGVAAYPTDADTWEELLGCSDRALYEAKHYRNVVRTYCGITETTEYQARMPVATATERD